MELGSPVDTSLSLVGNPNGLAVIPHRHSDVASFALIAPASFFIFDESNPLPPGTNRTSLNPSKRPKTILRLSESAVSGNSRKNRILFGGRYSSGMTGAAAVLEDLRPIPRAVLAGRTFSAGPGAPAGRLSFFCASRLHGLVFALQHKEHKDVRYEWGVRQIK